MEPIWCTRRSRKKTLTKVTGSEIPDGSEVVMTTDPSLQKAELSSLPKILGRVTLCRSVKELKPSTTVNTWASSNPTSQSIANRIVTCSQTGTAIRPLTEWLRGSVNYLMCWHFHSYDVHQLRSSLVYILVLRNYSLHSVKAVLL